MLEKCSVKIVPFLATLSTTALLTVNAFAADDISTAMVTAFAKVQTDVMAAITVVAPIALGIAGTFIVWRLGFNFFKNLSSGS